MTIGPEPSTRMCWISVRFGISPGPPLLAPEQGDTPQKGLLRGQDRSRGAFQEFHEAIEEVGRIVRAGRRLRVVLHAERLDVARPKALDHVVVEADVTHLHCAELRL